MIIRQSIFWALGLLVIYQLLAILVGSSLESRAEEFFKRQNEWKKMELCRAQRILSTDLTSQDVYVGSSLGDALSEAHLPRPYQKLTLIGGSALTGLSLIEKSGQRPRRIFIESNYALTRPSSKRVVRTVTGWRGWFVFRGMPVFRVAYRPADLLLIALFAPQPAPRLSDAAWEKRRQLLMVTPISDDFTPINQEVVRKAIELWRFEFEDRSEPKDGPLLEVLKRSVRALEMRGVEIVFYHMPVDTEVAAIGCYRRNQAVLAAHFPESRYLWIQPAPGFSYRTMDGFHLAGPSSMEFTRHLVTCIERKD